MKIVKTFLVALLLIGCQNKKTETMNNKKTFHFGAAFTSPNGYVVEIHEGYVANDKEMMSPFINMGNSDGLDWVYDGDAISGGTGMPTNFSLTWLSYAEKKFWLVEGKISPAAQAKIQALFEEGYQHTQWRSDGTGTESHVTYKTLCFGLAPSGLVVLWLAGEDRRVEIETYQAKETFVGVNAFCRNPREYNQEQFMDFTYNRNPKETQTYIAQYGLPLNRWRNYRKKFSYRFNVQYYKEDAESSERELKYLNGETEMLPLTKIGLYQEKALPLYARFIFNIYNGDATFDGEEIMKAFNTLSKNHPNKNIDINVKVAFLYKTLTFTVQCEDEVIPLKNVKVAMYTN